MCNISLLISVDRAVPVRAGQVTLSPWASLWGLPSLRFLSITHHASVVRSVALNCWLLFVRPENGFLSRAGRWRGAERPLGHWDFDNDLREVSSHDLLMLWWIEPQHKGQGWQWEAANREIFIKVLTPPRTALNLKHEQTRLNIHFLFPFFLLHCCSLSEVSI